MPARNPKKPKLISQGHPEPSDIPEPLQSFLLTFASQNIHTSPQITPHGFPTSGLGIQAKSTIAAGTELVRVLIHVLLLPSDVPEIFIDTRVRLKLGMRNHARVAAWIAFGGQGRLTKKERWLRDWTKTWPCLEELSRGMPICWPSAAKKSKILPPDVLAHLSKQEAKFVKDLKDVSVALPVLAGRLSQKDTPSEYTKFLHAWLCVNTRCFYFVPEGDPTPEDSDEAFAMCPFVDLWNHCDGSTREGLCDVTNDESGFKVTVSSQGEKGQELLTSYGSHGNAALWVEYGFMLDVEQNKWDSVVLPDEIVLKGLKKEEREMVARKGYDGDYTIRREGVCWRTEVLGYTGILKQDEWVGMVEGLWDVEDHEAGDWAEDRPINDGIQVIDYKDTKKRRAMRRIVGWVLELQKEVERSLNGLQGVDHSEIQEIFVGPSIGKEATNELAKFRFDMTVRRWRQTWETCMIALQSIEEEVPGSFVTGREGRMEWDLKRSVDDIEPGSQTP